MEQYATEDQQIAALKTWFSNNWLSLVGGVLLGLGVLFGLNAWNTQRNSHAELASFEFESLMQAVSKDDLNAAKEKGEIILGQYADTPYAGLASLAMAKINAEQNDLVAARSHLRWALDNATQDQVKHIARLRLAKVLLADAQYDEALGLLNKVEAGSFTAQFEELKGDIYVAKGETANARNAYSLALTAMLDGDARARQYVEIKLNDLGE